MRGACSRVSPTNRDAVDKCPNELETYIGKQGKDGCPDKKCLW